MARIIPFSKDGTAPMSFAAAVTDLAATNTSPRRSRTFILATEDFFLVAEERDLGLKLERARISRTFMLLVITHAQLAN